MTTSYTSRLGTAPEEGIKSPAVVSTSGNITLSGEQTIGSVAVVAGDRVLVRLQTDLTENGIYDVSTGAWTRSTDFNAADDLINGMLVPDASTYVIYRASYTGDWTPGTTEITFAASGIDEIGTVREVQTATAGQTLFTLSSVVYTQAINSLSVYINGVKQVITLNYTETSTNSVTFTSGLDLDDQVEFVAAQRAYTTVVPASQRGAETLAGGTAAVVFSVAEDDASYFVSLSGDTSETFNWSAKTTTGFTITSSNGGSTAVVDWILTR